MFFGVPAALFLVSPDLQAHHALFTSMTYVCLALSLTTHLELLLRIIKSELHNTGYTHLCESPSGQKETISAPTLPLIMS